MKTKFILLGTGTSNGVPFIGCNCHVCTSTDNRDKRLRSSMILYREDKVYLIDPGPDFRQQCLTFGIQHLDGIFLTHPHFDHIMGLGELKPLTEGRQPLKVYADENTINGIKGTFPYLFPEVIIESTYVRNPELTLVQIEAYGDIPELDWIRPVSVMHGNLPILGYIIDDQLAYLTDCKTLPDETINLLLQVEDAVVITSCLQFNEHPTHLIANEIEAFLDQINPDITILIHMAHEFTHVELEEFIGKSVTHNVVVGFDGLTYGSNHEDANTSISIRDVDFDDDCPTCGDRLPIYQPNTEFNCDSCGALIECVPDTETKYLVQIKK